MRTEGRGGQRRAAWPRRPTDRPIDISDERWSEALRREPVIRPLAANRRNSHAAVEAAARKLDLSGAQVYRLIKRFRDDPVTTSLVPDRPGPRKGARLLAHQIEEIIEDGIDTSYKRRERPTQQELLRHIRGKCAAAGLKPPSRKAIAARIAVRPHKEIIKAREGGRVANNRLDPVQPGLRPKDPLEIVQIDHTRADLQLVDDLRRKPLGRPWLTLVFDVHSRCVLGFTVSFDNPSAVGVGLAITQAVQPKVGWLRERGLEVQWPVYGIPRTLHLDHGRDFRSRALARGCEQYGITITYRPPGRPNFGGHIERMMGTLMKRVHALPGTTSSNVVQRGNYPSEEKAAITLSSFEKILALIISEYHNEIHSALGKAPLAVWRDGVERTGNPRTPDDPNEFLLNFLPFTERIVRREGIRLSSKTYFDPGLSTLIGGNECKRRIVFDPRDVTAIFVEMPDKSHVRVACVDPEVPPTSLWEHKAEMRRLRVEGRSSRDEVAIVAAHNGISEIVSEERRKQYAARRGIGHSPATQPGGAAEQPAPTPPKPNSENSASGWPDDDEATIPQTDESETSRTEIL